MVLDYLGEPVNYARIGRRLGITEDGTPFFHIDRLSSLRLKSLPSIKIESGSYGDFPLLEAYLEAGFPVITGVTTFTWQHWNNQAVEHAVVVAGIDDEDVYIHDPAFSKAPIRMTHLEFEIGWYEKDLYYAIIRSGD